MENNHVVKTKKKGKLPTIFFYIFALILLITAFISLTACHQNISAQLAQGVSVKGNELAILNFYLSSCVQYFTLAALLFFCGFLCSKQALTKTEVLEVAPNCAENALPGIIAPMSSNVDGEENDGDFAGWSSMDEDKQADK